MPTPRSGRPSTSLTPAALRCLPARTVPARTVPALLAGALVLGLTACGGSAPAAEAPTEAVTPAAASAASGGAAPVSDVIGRHFDLGTIDRLEDSDGVPVAVLDRFTAKGIPDSEIADRGLQIKPFTDPPFENLGRQKYRIPVTADATFVYHHCVAPDQPLQSQPTDLQHMGSLGEPEDIVVITLNDKGEMTHAENEPGC